MNPSAERIMGRIRLSGGLTGAALWLLPLAGLFLLGLKAIWHLPGELLLTLGAGFGVAGAVVGLAGRAGRAATASRVALWLLVWLLGSALVLGAVYRVDRAGWVWFRMTGYDLVIAEDLEGDIPLDRAAFLARHPIFLADGESGIRLPRGTHDLLQTVVVPRGTPLRIEPGAVLRMGAGRSLISYGRLLALGTPTEPVRFIARHRWLKWGVVAVVGAGASRFEHVHLEDGRRARVNGIDFPGALSLIESDAVILDSRFVSLYGKDAVYVRSSNVEIRDNLFRDAHKDGLDLDGGTGEVRGNLFVDCLDEGIDLDVAAQALVVDNVILDSRGGRVASARDAEALHSRNRLGYSDGAGR